MASTSTRLMTVEEFQKLPEAEAYAHELRKGELVKVTRPALKHVFAQHRLHRLLTAAAGGAEVVFIELGFRPLPEYELRVADVAYALRERWDQVNPSGHLAGAPDLVIEVLSPSNTAAEMLEKEQICLENGAYEFWIVDLDRRQVRVSTRDGHVATYKPGQSIPLFFTEGATLAVDAIFESAPS
jgi:Uma2 family endonuclease